MHISGMLLKKFPVDCQILNNVARYSFSAFRCSRKVPQGDKSIEWAKKKIHVTSEQYKKKLKDRLPKLSFAQFCCKKLFSSTEPKREVNTAGEDYKEAQRSLKLRIEEMVKFVEQESQSLVSDVKSRLDSSRAARAAQLDQLLENTTRKLDELIKLDVPYGKWMRKETLLLHDEIKRSFDAAERAIALNVKRVASSLKKLREDVSTCVERTERNLVACRGHDVPADIAECAKRQLSEATKMLDLMNEEARRKLKEIAKFRETVVKGHEITAREIIEVNRKKAAKLSDYLDRCIVQLKKSSK